MPNHVHGIIIITDGCRGGTRSAPTDKRKPLGRLIGAFKTVSAKRINEIRGFSGTAVWRRNYYEHIIRKDESLNQIREYIINNPLQWVLDRENPATAVRPADAVGAVRTADAVGAVRTAVSVGAVREPPQPKNEPWRV